MYGTTTTMAPPRRPLGAPALVLAVASTVFVGLAGVVLAFWLGERWWVNVVVPLTALASGVVLFRAAPLLYVGYVWWLWFLSPFVRRVVDLYVGFTEPSPVLLAPYLVAGLSVWTVWQHRGRLTRGAGLPFVVALSGVAYGYLVGVLQVSPMAATYALLQWATPPLFGFHLWAQWRSYPDIGRVVRRTFGWAVFVMGLYGIIQFYLMPPWDALWVDSADVTSIGKSQPFRVRVFSTLNSPGPFAAAMLAGLLMLFVGRHVGYLVAAVPGYVSFLLALTRAAWGGWAVGLAWMALRSSPAVRRGFVRLFLLSVLLALPLVAVDQVRNQVSARLATFQHMDTDKSFRARVAAYTGVPWRIVAAPQGFGLGYTGTAQKVDSGETRSMDSGVLNVPLTLGWPGAILYLAGLAILLWRTLRDPTAFDDPFAVASHGIIVAMLAMLFFANTQTGLGGCLMWGFLGLSAAAGTYHRARARGAA